MFTGIVRAIGAIAQAEPRGGDLRLTVDCAALDLGQASLGDSIAVNGVCLTAAALEGQRFAADLSAETLARTTLGSLAPGRPVNLEPALRAGDALGGHLVSGHVDGVARLLGCEPVARGYRLEVAVPEALARYIAPKGSVCLDGISLTVNEVRAAHFSVHIVPHTWESTTVHRWAIGDPLNVEVDLVARYLERLMQARSTEETA